MIPKIINRKLFFSPVSGTLCIGIIVSYCSNISELIVFSLEEIICELSLDSKEELSEASCSFSESSGFSGISV